MRPHRPLMGLMLVRLGQSKPAVAVPMTTESEPGDNPYAPPKHADASDRQGDGHWMTWSILSTLPALAANVIAVGFMLTLAALPTGAAIRPMGHAAVAGLCALFALFVGAPISALLLFVAPRWRCKAIAMFGIVLNLAPFPLAAITMSALAAMIGFTLKE